MAVVSVFVVNTRIDLTQIRLQEAANKIKSDIRYVQLLAIAIQKRTGILFSAASDTYSVYIEDSPGNWSLAIDPLTKESFVVQLNSGDFSGIDLTVVYFNGYNQALVFDKWGNPYGYNVPARSASVLANPAGVRISGTAQTTDVRVERGTGRVYLQ